MIEAEKELFNSERPILLIGMTGCGKTSIGRILADILELPFFDTDLILSSDMGNVPAGKIFSDIGEERFREKEYIAFQKALANGKCVIASGGGLPTYKKSYSLAKERTIPIHILRNVTKVDLPKNPPVCGDMQKYLSIIKEREPIYNSLAVLSYENIGEAQTAEQIAHDAGIFYKK